MDALLPVLEALREELRHDPAYGETQIIPLAYTERTFSTIIEATVLGQNREPQHVFIKIYKRADQKLPERLAQEYLILCDLHLPTQSGAALSVVKPVRYLSKHLALVTERSHGDSLQHVLIRHARWSPTLFTRAELAHACNSCGRWLSHFQHLKRVDECSRAHFDALIGAIEVHLRRLRTNNPAYNKLQSRVMAYVAASARNTDAAGLEITGVHGDFFPGNVIINAQHITVLDFETYRHGPIYADVAYFWYQLQTLALKPWYSNKLIANLQRAFLNGYHAVKDQEDDVDKHPVFTLFLIKLVLSRLADFAELRGNPTRRCVQGWAEMRCRRFLEHDLLKRPC
jgi:hypothetical protein